MRSIDLNCDLGEGMSNDEELMKLISSANIACGFHAGDRDTMKKTVGFAMKYGVAVGAHPSYPDRENFGRRDMLGELTLNEVEDCIRDQMDRMIEVCIQEGCRLHHVKPHGALYNRAAKDQSLSERIASLVAEYDSTLILYGLSGSEMSRAAGRYKLNFKHEVFADRGYADDGSLLPRNIPGAVLDSPQKSLEQALQMIQQGVVTTSTGKTISILADTICVHGDSPRALEIATHLRNGLAIHHCQISASNGN
jgi:UPF0271 protein